MSVTPKAQLIPTLKGFANFIVCQKASNVCPDKVLPLLSTIVTDIIIGKLIFLFSK